MDQGKESNRIKSRLYVGMFIGNNRLARWVCGRRQLNKTTKWANNKIRDESGKRLGSVALHTDWLDLDLQLEVVDRSAGRNDGG